MITFRDDAPQLPGYRIEYVENVADCAAEPEESSFDTRELGLPGAPPHSAANASRDDGTSAIPNRRFGAVSEHLLGLYTTCDFEGEIRWIFDFGGAVVLPTHGTHRSHPAGRGRSEAPWRRVPDLVHPSSRRAQPTRGGRPDWAAPLFGSRRSY